MTGGWPFVAFVSPLAIALLSRSGTHRAFVVMDGHLGQREEEEKAN